MSQHIRINRMNDVEVRREYKAAVEWKCEEARAKRYTSGEDVEKAWIKLKEWILNAVRVCGSVK